MLYGFCPYQSNSIATLISAIEEKPLYFDSAYNVPPIIKKFISRCLQKDYRHRISWDEFFEEVSHLSGANI
jgi:serine/threonine protein kinase